MAICPLKRTICHFKWKGTYRMRQCECVLLQLRQINCNKPHIIHMQISWKYHHHATESRNALKAQNGFVVFFLVWVILVHQQHMFGEKIVIMIRIWSERFYLFVFFFFFFSLYTMHTLWDCMKLLFSHIVNNMRPKQRNW